MTTGVTLERYAEIRADIEAGGLRDEVLARAGLLVDQWTEAQTEWLERMGKELDRGRFELTNRYTQAFIDRQRTAGSSATNGPAQLDANKEAPPPLPAPPAEVLAPPALLRPTPIGALPERPWSASQPPSPFPPPSPIPPAPAMSSPLPPAPVVPPSPLPPRPASAPPAPLRSTVMAMDLSSFIPVLPFGVPSAGVGDSSVPPADGAGPRLPKRPPAALTGTSISSIPVKGSALPFRPSDAPPDPPPSAPPSTLAPSALTAALPFQPSGSGSRPAPPLGSEPPNLAATAAYDAPIAAAAPPPPPVGASDQPAAPKPMPSPRPAPANLGATVFALEIPKGPALPFSKAPSAGNTSDVSRSPVAGNSSELLRSPMASHSSEVFRPPVPGNSSDLLRPPLVPPTQAPAGGPPPPLSLEHYASLYVELSIAPARSGEAFSRYRLSGPEAWEAADGYWQQRFRSEPTLRAQWLQLVNHYRAYMAQRR